MVKSTDPEVSQVAEPPCALVFSSVKWRYGSMYTFKVVLRLKLEKAMAPHSSTLAWKIPWMEEPSRLQSMGSLESETTE